ncbi:hypothetical protein GCM10009779_34270 [Polymorphospora rubra]|uniref:Uncharacterized protein n=1 Tax=Polymorphospora rubra TaxID=338584 RepID=A0A810NDM7_9ACTN|nr:hypothetical protein Prubr_74450 [Polymorphospora rubra]
MPESYPPIAVTQSLAGRLYLEHPRSLRFTTAHDHPSTAAHHITPAPEQDIQPPRPRPDASASQRWPHRSGWRQQSVEILSIESNDAICPVEPVAAGRLDASGLVWVAAGAPARLSPKSSLDGP